MMELLNYSDWVIRASDSHQLERIEAFFSGHAFEPHQHDTFAIGRTLAGVQSFYYRGAMRHSQSGMTIVLHPDEKHDGHAGTQEGFRYRMMYIEPALIQKIVKGKPLPFIKQGLSHDPRLYQATNILLQNMNDQLSILEKEDALYDLATTLYEVAGQSLYTRKNYDYIAAEKAREFIHASLDQDISLSDLEQHIQRDRWSLSRDFRLLFGTSPHRYMIMRRLEIVKKCLINNESLTQTAMIAGFFDQSHMTRHFTRTFGVTPARWKQIYSQLK